MMTLEEQLINRLDITKGGDGSIHSRGSISLSNETFEHIPVSFSIIDGDLEVIGLPNLKDLSNTPKVVGGNYILMDCPNLTSWKGNSVVSCMTLGFWLGTGIDSFTGGPLEVSSQIDAKPDMDFFDLPLGGWDSITFGDGYEQRSKNHLLRLVYEFKDVTVTDLPKHLGDSTPDPLRSWFISRIMQGLKPFNNY